MVVGSGRRSLVAIAGVGRCGLGCRNLGGVLGGRCRRKVVPADIILFGTVLLDTTILGTVLGGNRRLLELYRNKKK